MMITPAPPPLEIRPYVLGESRTFFFTLRSDRVPIKVGNCWSKWIVLTNRSIIDGTKVITKMTSSYVEILFNVCVFQFTSILANTHPSSVKFFSYLFFYHKLIYINAPTSS